MKPPKSITHIILETGIEAGIETHINIGIRTEEDSPIIKNSIHSKGREAVTV